MKNIFHNNIIKLKNIRMIKFKKNVKKMWKKCEKNVKKYTKLI